MENIKRFLIFLILVSFSAIFASITGTVNLLAPANNTWTSYDNNTLNFTFNHTGTLSGVVTCNLTINGTMHGQALNATNGTTIPANTNTNVKANINFATDRSYNWTINCTNTTNSEEATPWIINTDYVAPSLERMSPSTNIWTSNSSILLWFNLTDTGSGVNRSTINVIASGGSMAFDPSTDCTSITNGFKCNATWTTPTDGTYTINVTGNDTITLGPDNMNNSQLWSLKVDKTPPNVTINTPGPDTFQTGTIEINITVTDTGSGVDNNTIFYQLLNSTGNVTGWIQMVNISANGYNISLDTTQYPDGYYNISFRANDTIALGPDNMNDTERVQIKIDNTPPSITVISYNFTDVTNLNFEFNATINDSVFGLTNINVTWIRINSTDNTQTSSYYGLTNKAGATWNYTFTANFSSPYFGPGPHFVQFCANDTIGHNNCTWSSSPFVIKVVNASQIESIVSAAGPWTLNITYENGTDVGIGTNIPGMDPTQYNYTCIMTIGNITVKLVGFLIDETQMQNMTNMSANNTVTTNLNSTIQAIHPEATNLVVGWMNVSRFLPAGSNYSYGEVVLDGIYDLVYYCNGTITNPSCVSITECNATVNYTSYSAIPSNSGCYLNNVSDGKTHIYLDYFSGGVGAGDTTPPSISDQSPTGTITNTLPTISASYSDNGTGINTSTVVLKLNGVEVSATVTNSSVSYTPPSDLDTGYAHTVYLEVKDKAGNLADSVWTFEISPGGGGVSSGPGGAFIADIVLAAGESIEYELAKFDFTTLSLTAAKDISANIDIDKIDVLPEDISEPPETAYGYYRISTGITEDEIEEAILSFRVPVSWYEENSLDPETTTLLRYEEEWHELDTELVDSDDEYYYFEASVPGFSYFAITAKAVTPECPTCPEPSAWSECVEGSQTRTNYRCGPETDYKCESYTEVRSCVVGPQCGNEVCEDECTTCPQDCTVADCCGNGLCDEAVGEDYTNCPTDCPPPKKFPWVWVVVGILITGMLAYVYYCYRRGRGILEIFSR